MTNTNLVKNNELFFNARNKIPQKTPPIWFMRQAGRYHKHYQALRAKHSFEILCRNPELAAQVALGPIQDFDFDVSILFSDLLFPLDAMGMKLSYSDAGPHLEHSLAKGYQLTGYNHDKALTELQFQSQALKITREMLPQNKSLIGFVGGFWTLYVYAAEGGHAGSLIPAKSLYPKSQEFVKALIELIEGNIQQQLNAGAEVVMVFDTSAGEVSSQFYKEQIAPTLIKWAHKFPHKLGYYSKGTQPSFFTPEFLSAPWAGRGVDHRWNIVEAVKTSQAGFIQGNFDQAMLFQETRDFKKTLGTYISAMKELSIEERAGWVCGLGHGVLPKTPEHHVKYFIETIRAEF
ncbi:MAG: uroporphyrinogen decarboxylase family protein [Pseudobdellovibrio sp.]